MAKYKIAMSIVVEAGSQEDVCSALSGRFATIARHLGNGETLEANDPFFTIAEVTKGDPVDLKSDPVRAEQIFNDQPAHGVDVDPDAEPEEPAQ